MDRLRLVELFVLDAICDDYENIDQVILRDVAKAGLEHSLNIGRTEVVEALERLVGSGFAKAYFLSGSESLQCDVEGMPDVAMVEEYFRTYFYITASGLKYYTSTNLASV